MEVSDKVIAETTELLKLTQQLANMDFLPNDINVRLNYSHRPHDNATGVIERISELVGEYGCDPDYRTIIVNANKVFNVQTSFKPLERDSYGWVTAAYITPKGYFFY